MNSRSGLPSSDPAADGAYPARIERADADFRDEALGFLLTGRREAGEAAVRPFLAFAESNRLDLNDLWAVWDGRRLAATALIVPGVGKTAMLFLSPVASHGRVALSGQLVDHAVKQLDPEKICLVQALLEHGQDLQQRAIEAGNFRFLAELAYMSRPGREKFPLPPITLEGTKLQAVNWSEDARPLFADAIGRSYQDTLDCPGLLGLREMDDIIAGHMATGRFEPTHWTVWKHPATDEPAAVLLLAESSSGAGFELVYLGVCPHARRRGLSKTIMHHALDTTARGGKGDLYLAVDCRNEPALRLYRGLGFRVTTRKSALIQTPGR